MKRRLFLSIIILTLIFAVSCKAMSGLEKQENDKKEFFKEIQLFSDTLAIVQSDYVDEVKPKDIIYGALKGMLSSLDPHSQFMDPDTYNELKVDTEGKFGGLGIEITIKDGLLTVVSPIDDTPAWKAGVKANDKIVKIDDELTRDITLIDAVKKLRGKPGTSVKITVLRDSEKKLLDFTIVRDVIKIKDIKEARVLEDGIGYIRLVEFRENTAKDLDTEIRKLQKEGMRGLILDLRNDPGGLLEVAVKVTEKFIEKDKLIVSTKGRKENQTLEFYSRLSNPITDLPMVILINEGSASGSEIVAGCLQDYKRAIIMGTKSFGKGSVQTVIPLSDGSAVRLTTSKYFTPKGRVIHEKGIVPDIVVEEAKVEFAETQKAESKSEEVFKQIENEKNTKENKETAFNYKTDNQLMSAIDVLKALLIYREPKNESN